MSPGPWLPGRSLVARPRRNAFTLIELLIVVAIISILAAIAVPNFLHAQLRAKVTRVKADVAQLAIAVEAYAVDYGVYPPTQDTVVTLGSSQLSGSIYSGWRLLPCTTPIAYVTHLYNDPFALRGGRASGPNLPPDTNFVTEPLPYFWRNVTEVIRNGQVVKDPTYPLGGQQDYWIQKTGRHPIYVFFSFGPDKDYRGAYLEPTYDPSNGLLSDGEIYMLGPGNEFIEKSEGL